MTSRVPIFVVGCQRSGTSFLGDLLGRKPGVVTLPEAQFMYDLLARPNLAMSKTDAGAAVEWLIRQFRFWTLGLTISKVELEKVAFGKTPLEFWNWIVSEYGRSVGRTDFKYWVEHSPENMFVLPKLFELFDTARAIHIVRDGRGVFSSFRELNWGPYSARRAATTWVSAAMTGVALENLYPDRIARIRYEDLLENPDRELRRAMGKLSVDGAEAPAGESTLRLPEFTLSQHELVGKAPDSAKIDAWRRKLTESEIVKFEQVAGACLSYFGYEPSSVAVLANAGGMMSVKDVAYDIAKMFIGRARLAMAERRLVNEKIRNMKYGTWRRGWRASHRPH